jgi:hypothetical protein
MALTTVTVHAEILDPNGNVPAVGTVTWRILHELQDVVDNVTYSPATYIATLDVNGEFTIVLPATDNPDITPLNWVYQVYVATDVWTETLYFQLPFAVGVTEFADLQPLDFDPCTSTTALPTPIAPSDYDLFVRRAGDTMSGNLVINANLQVAGSAAASYQGISGDLVRFLSTMLSTNVTSGGEITPNVDPTKIDIAPLEGWIVDYNSTTTPIGPTNPALTYISYPGATAVTPLFVPLSFYLIDSAGVLFQQATRPTSAQRRQNLLVGLTVTEAGVVVVDQTIPVVPSQVNNQLVDLMNNLGPFIISGNIISPNGVNLTFNKTAGPIFARAFSQVPNYLAPNEATLPAQTPTNFRRITAAPGFASGVVNTIDVANYDPNATGIVTPIPGGANTSTNFRVWAVANNITNDQIFVQYGQRSYASLATARAAISSGQYVPNPITVGAALVGWITATKSAVNLSDPTQAIFTQAGKFSTP